MATKKSTKKLQPAKARKSTKKPERFYEGPAEWLLPMMEETYTRLRPKGEAEAKPTRGAALKAKRGGKAAGFASVHQEGKGESVLAKLPKTHWEEMLREYSNRKAKSASREQAAAPEADTTMKMAVVPGANNWTPIGPSVMARGQTLSRAAISGRISGIAIAPGGAPMYVATANGGVWRSDDNGRSWSSTMDIDAISTWSTSRPQR